MKLLKDYKGVAVFFAVITAINLVWVLSYQRPSEQHQVQNERVIVANV